MYPYMSFAVQGYSKLLDACLMPMQEIHGAGISALGHASLALLHRMDGKLLDAFSYQCKRCMAPVYHHRRHASLTLIYGTLLNACITPMQEMHRTSVSALETCTRCITLSSGTKK